MIDITPAGDGWRFRSPCAGGCGVSVVTDSANVMLGECVDCGRRRHGAQVPVRPVPGANNHLRMGQGGVGFPGPLDHDRLMPPPSKPASKPVIGLQERWRIDDSRLPTGARRAVEVMRNAGWEVGILHAVAVDAGSPIETIGVHTPAGVMMVWKRTVVRNKVSLRRTKSGRPIPYRPRETTTWVGTALVRGTQRPHLMGINEAMELIRRIGEGSDAGAIQSQY